MSQPAAYSIVASIGPDGAGKTTLAGALARSLHERDAASVTPPRTVQVSGMNVGVFEFRTPRGLYQHVDFENASVEAHLLASSPPATVILHVCALDGPLPGTQKSLTHAHNARAGRVVVALTKCDAVDDPELLDLVELEIRAMLSKYHYPENSPVVRVSATGAMRGDHRWGGSVLQLAAALDGEG
jgi:elongation factor Tu